MTRRDYRCDDGSFDSVLGALNGKGLRERDQTHLRGGVVRLTKVTVQTGGGGGVHDSAELLFPKDGPNCLRARVGTLEVDCLDLVPFRFGHVPETVWCGIVSSFSGRQEFWILPLISKDSGIVDQDCDPTERVQSRLDHRSTIRHGRGIHYSLSAGYSTMGQSTVSDRAQPNASELTHPW